MVEDRTVHRRQGSYKRKHANHIPFDGAMPLALARKAFVLYYETKVGVDVGVRAGTNLFINLCSPPLEPADPSRIDDCEEDNYNAESKPRIQCRRKSHGIFSPPGRCTAAKEPVEQEADEGPDREIEAGLLT